MTSEETKDMKDMDQTEADAEVTEEAAEESQEAEQSEAAAEETAEASEGEAAEGSEVDPDNAELSALNKKYMRLAADFQNFKRRTEKEKSDIRQFANEKIALDVIEVIDNFERALAHIEDCEDKQFAEGVEKIYKQLQGVLEKNKIEEIKAEGEPFDPNFHNAMMIREVEGVESGIVVNDMQKGYTLNGRVIRASMVMVSQ